MDRPLTGGAAVEAIGLYARLGAADVRFDARRVAEAVRTRAGRLRLAGALSRCVSTVVALNRPRPRSFRARRSVARRLASRASKSPSHPGGPVGREGRNG